MGCQSVTTHVRVSSDVLPPEWVYGIAKTVDKKQDEFAQDVGPQNGTYEYKVKAGQRSTPHGVRTEAEITREYRR